MTVIGFCGAQPSSVGNRGRGADRKYDLTFNVETDSANDEAGVVLDYMESQGYVQGAFYSFNDYIDYLSQQQRMIATRRPNSTVHWTVKIQYGPPEIQVDFQTPNAAPAPGTPYITSVPEEARYDISSVTQLVQIPVEQAWNIDKFPKDDPIDTWAYRRDVDTLGPVVNSAGVPYDPPPMVEYSETILRIAGNRSIYDATLLEYSGQINDGTIYWHQELKDNYGFEPQTFTEYTVKCTGATASYNRMNYTPFWRYEYEFRIRKRLPDGAPFDGWLEQILDRGVSRRTNPGSGATAPTGATTLTEAMIDLDGKRVPEIVLMDGNGRPLIGSETFEPPPVYFRWRTNLKSAFSGIPLDIFQNTPPT